MEVPFSEVLCNGSTTDFDFEINDTTINKDMNEVDFKQLKESVTRSKTFNELYKKTGIGIKKLKRLCEDNNICFNHFTPGIGKSTRGKRFTASYKICIQCGVHFKVTTKVQNEKQKTCSRSCSNRIFRVGESHGNWKPYSEKSRKNEYYRRLCFNEHGKKCIVCEEKIAIDVHHVDGNHQNNNTNNLIPLCANHHRYAHLKETKDYIESKIKEYIRDRS